MSGERISTPADAAALIWAALPKEQREERVFVLPLDSHGKVLAKPILVSVGHEDGTATIDAGTIFREALKAGAEEIIVAHNHPSGNLTPSKADLAAARELQALSSRSGWASPFSTTLSSGQKESAISFPLPSGTAEQSLTRTCPLWLETEKHKFRHFLSHRTFGISWTIFFRNCSWC